MFTLHPKRSFVTLLFAAVAAVTTPGCGNLSRQAAAHDRVAEAAGSAADQIDAKLAGMDAAQQAGADAASLRALVPVAYQPFYDALVSAGQSAVDSFATVSARLRDLQAANEAQAAELRRVESSGADEFTKAATAIGAAASGINPAIPLVTTLVLGVGAAIKSFRSGQVSGARHTTELVNVGRHESDSFNDEFAKDAGEAMRKAMDALPAVVAATIKSTKL